MPTAFRCPSDEQMAAFVGARLSEADRKRILVHLVRCDDCYRVFAETVRFQGAHPSPGAGGGTDRDG